MTVRVERTFDLDASPESVWAFISDPRKRAEPISVVDEFEVTGEGTATWHVKLPIPLVNRTTTIETRETDVEPPEYVRFVGRSKVMRVVGEHELTPHDGGTRLTNRFTVDGKLPGVEKYFERNLDGELDNLERALRRELG
ncbi:SRPBCC family protein [Halomarina oriensis]|uniref:Polyketide cyclase n=1 Tax=Halomarina oriensis TaxID=671145 RepID=A0A6B0GPF3_9EURY|nr:SRPBCC family protein [Halomarina oriensis]MWG35871.1 polyketide cyclase [Halomarina oriensis]